MKNKLSASTPMRKVSEELSKLDNDLAREWLQNEIIKMKLAISYDDWIEDTGYQFTLMEHILYYLENPVILSPDFGVNYKI
jgi:hypothetical protein